MRLTRHRRIPCCTIRIGAAKRRSRQFTSKAGRGMGFAPIQNQMFAGVHERGDIKYLQMPKTVSIIGAPMTYGQTYIGTDKSPAALRAGGLHSNLKSLNWRIDDIGDLDFDPPTQTDPTYGPEHGDGAAHQSACVGRGNQQISDAVSGSLEAGHFVLTLGGDHSIGVGTVSGVLRQFPNAGLIWVDAHADLNTPATSSSGNIHGMPIGFMLEGLFDAQLVPGFEWLGECDRGSNHHTAASASSGGDATGGGNGGGGGGGMPATAVPTAPVPRLSPEQIVYIGLRDVDAMERRWIRNYGIKAFTMQDVDAHGIGGVVAAALAHLAGRPLHMSYDIDAIDPDTAPSTGTAVRGGLTYREANYVCEAVSDTGALVALDMVELNVNLETQEADKTIEVGQQLIASAMGRRIL